MAFDTIVLDLDGTLLRGDHTLGEFTRKTLEDLHHKANKDIIIASGRHYVDIKYVSSQLTFPLYVVSSNGARAYYNHSEEPVFSESVDKDTVVSLLDMFSRNDDVVTNIYTSSGWLRNKEDPVYGPEYFASGFAASHVDFTNGEAVFDIVNDAAKVFLTSEDHVGLCEKESFLSQTFDGITTAFSLKNCLEMTAKGVCKAKALEFILQKHQKDFATLVAFGDGMNDETMLRRAGKGVVMGNADDRLKERLPNLEVIGTNDDESVAKYLQELFL